MASSQRISLWQRWLLMIVGLLCGCLAGPGHAGAAGAGQTAAVRVLLVTTNTHLLPAAEARLRELAGPGRVVLDAVTAVPDEAQVAAADVIYAYFAPTAVLRQMAPAVRQARQRGALVLAAPAASAEAAWGFGLDAARNQAAEAYWSAGGADNLAGWLAWLVAAVRGDQAIAVPPPRPLPAAGIYHPRAAQAFATLKDYLAWYRAGASGVPADAPLVGIAFYASHYRQQDLAHIDALVAALERQGIGAVPVFGWPLSGLDPMLTVDGQSPLRALLALNLTISRAEDKAWLERHGLHAVNLIATRDSQAGWRADVRGIGVSAASAASACRCCLTRPSGPAPRSRSCSPRSRMSTAPRPAGPCRNERTRRWPACGAGSPCRTSPRRTSTSPSSTTTTRRAAAISAPATWPRCRRWCRSWRACARRDTARAPRCRTPPS
ncbi:hydrogenobyrinic acid a,c-diamide cobaltochelatase [Cupriavidus basilensis OR16]|uniref:Hydrogenobyrinic acid a,c-diamide cobaltochelatase n=1 Tax=Cupriavidus basilensis OR16 TaxID=1127483 RepID=H1S502_9BURK|nr:hydrogenobyrinic acid a,c-diamide cobaltochelatase [Cupriavidus basilensis OR16]